MLVFDSSRCFFVLVVVEGVSVSVLVVVVVVVVVVYIEGSCCLRGGEVFEESEFSGVGKFVLMMMMMSEVEKETQVE